MLWDLAKVNGPALVLFQHKAELGDGPKQGKGHDGSTEEDAAEDMKAPEAIG